MERRLAAILAADVVGYSRLMEADEAATLAALKLRRKDVLDPLVAKHQGRVFKTTGDGVLVEFASAVNAVQCAVDLQQGMATANGSQQDDRHIVLRVGVNLGDVMVEGSDLYGDGVNIAARLETIAEPGGILISGTAHDHVKNKVRFGFDDLGAQTLKNIAEPVRAYRIIDTPAVAMAVHKAAADKPSIAVLPFDNMSGDPEQQYFSDGITEDIITELSRFRSLFIIARNSSFQYRDKAMNMKRIGRELDVRYLLEGSVRKIGDRVRITAQLIDVVTGGHLWAERFDRDLADIFAVQDEVVQTIAARLTVRLETEELELARRRPPQDLRAYDLWLRGKVCLNLWTGISNAEARGLFEQAIQIDPTYARAYSGLASSYEWAAWYSRWAPDGDDPREVALQYARKALAFDDTDHEPHMVLAWIYHERRHFDQSRRHLDRALALNPNDADALSNRGMILTLQGDPETGANCVEAAMRLNPHHPDTYIAFLGASYLFGRKFEQSIHLREGLSIAFPEGHAVLAAAYALAGDLHNAAKTMTDFLSSYHLYWRGSPSARHIANLMSLKRPEDDALLMDGLRKAGMPE